MRTWGWEKEYLPITNGKKSSTKNDDMKIQDSSVKALILLKKTYYPPAREKPHQEASKLVYYKQPP